MRILLNSLVLCCALLVIGCGGAQLLDAPRIVSVKMGETSVTVTWEADTAIEQNVDFQGYNVYVSADSNELLVQSGEDLNKINPEVIADTIYEVRNLSQDTVFYFQVRTVNTEDRVGDYNDNVPFIAASPRPEFTVTLRCLTEEPTNHDSCAIRFFDATIMSDLVVSDSGADMYVYDPYYDHQRLLFSPDTHPQYGAGARHTNFANLGQQGFDDVSAVTTEPTNGYADVDEGDLVIARTEDDNYVKIRVDAIDTTLIKQRVTITYAYQNIAGFRGF